MNDVEAMIQTGAADKIADLIHRLAGPMAEEIGLLLGDKVKVYRLKNWLKVVEKTGKILREANVLPRAVPARILLPVLESSSLENNENLQDL